MNDRPNIREIAEIAGVSPATVSRVLNGNCNRETDTYKHVRRILHERAYMRKKRVFATETILCVNEYSEDVITGHALMILAFLDEIASRRKMKLATIHTSDVRRISDRINDRGIAGVIYLGGSLPEAISKPTVVLNCNFVHSQCCSVDCDDLTGMVMMLRHLEEMGHERVAYFADAILANANHHPRKSDVKKAYQLAGVDYNEKFIFDFDLTSSGDDSAFNQVASDILVMKRDERPTALMLTGDTYAPFAYKVFAERGIRVPNDLSVAGFDDEPLCMRLVPALTTIRKPLEAMCEMAMDLLCDSLVRSGGNTLPRRILIRPELVVRDSVRRREGVFNSRL